MEANGSEIDIYAIGTHIATSKKQPALGLVCKLTEIKKVPRMKFSSDPEKTTLPGNKAVYRVWLDKSDRASFDLITLENEAIRLGENTFYCLNKEEEQIYNIAKLQRMNEILDTSNFTQTLFESKQYVKKSIAELPNTLFKLSSPTKHTILMTSNYLQALNTARKANQPK